MSVFVTHSLFKSCWSICQSLHSSLEHVKVYDAVNMFMSSTHQSLRNGQHVQVHNMSKSVKNNFKSPPLIGQHEASEPFSKHYIHREIKIRLVYVYLYFYLYLYLYLLQQLLSDGCLVCILNANQDPQNWLSNNLKVQWCGPWWHWTKFICDKFNFKKHQFRNIIAALIIFWTGPAENKNLKM